MLFPAGGMTTNQHGKGGGGGGTYHAGFFSAITHHWNIKSNLNYINEYPIIIWPEEIRGQGRWKKGKKMVW